MNKFEIYSFLKNKNISFEVTEHEAVFTMDALANISLPYPELDAKNIFVRDDKKQNYYLISLIGNKKLDLKQFRRDNNTRPLSFASANELMDIMKLIPGAVTPFGVLNDVERKVQVFIDMDFTCEPSIIGVHPNDNTATIWLNINDLINIIKDNGNKVQMFKAL